MGLSEGCEKMPKIGFLLQLPIFRQCSCFYHLFSVPLRKFSLNEFIKEDLEIRQPFKYLKIVVWERNY